MKWVDYREKLGIGLDDKEKHTMCMNRIRNIVLEYDRYYSENELYKYMNTVGESIEDCYYSIGEEIKVAVNSVCAAKTFKEFLSKYVALINSANENRMVQNGNTGKFISEVFEAAITGTLEDFSIPYDIYRDNDGVFIFPKGVPEFDRELVSNNLLWLENYPETEKAWVKALKDYSSGEEPSEVADNFRKALERFFQRFFHSEKTLESMKSEYGRYLKDHGIPSEIAGNFETLLQQYTNFMNGFAKHHDKTVRSILEYIMYQTGNIIRLLIKLDDE